MQGSFVILEDFRFYMHIQAVYSLPIKLCTLFLIQQPLKFSVHVESKQMGCWIKFGSVYGKKASSADQICCKC